ncbi:MAG: hypothetical protein MJZ34_10550 [Paludibacteraceae bacterium]|nr:hypothetical protein [Paludibacteraceae bacterium]
MNDVTYYVQQERARKKQLFFKQKLVYIFQEIYEYCQDFRFIISRMNSSNTSIYVACGSYVILSAYNEKLDFSFDGQTYMMSWFENPKVVEHIKNKISEIHSEKQAEMICNVFKPQERVCIDGDVGTLQVVDMLGVMLKMDNNVLKKYDPLKIKDIKCV